ncbi:hypothetical protein, partial [Dyadobacter sp. BHUBP1]|uniref:hypothetical protein n=1 Tax=Dyadobacter sp. BHUBP1 TaxID=3424178 RepID=UPI003D3483D9
FVGISLPCATTLITPILYKSTSGDVCANGSPITLTASGFSGQLEWYLNDVLITGTQPGQTQYIATVAGTYKVRSKSGSSYSSFSNTIVLNQKAGCVPPNQCAANRVKLLWRNYNHDRLVGATIQGSSNGVDWIVLYQFPSAAPVGTWLTTDFNNPQNYPHIRYNARATDGVGDLKEIRFFNVDGSGNETALTGTGFGSEPNLAGQGWANALDG